MQLYGLSWPFNDPIDIEIAAIKGGGRWTYKGQRYGEGLFHHYKALQTQLWPWKQWDPWSELILKSLIDNRMTLLSGPANATKTHSVAAFIICRYLVWPVNNCTLVSSTDSRSLELRIWGEIKKLWNQARARYEDTPGRLVESKQMIVTDDRVDKATDYRSGIIAVPCLVGGTFVGIGKFVGVKSGSLFMAGDELQFMALAYYDVIANLRKNAGFRFAGMFNPKDRTDVAGKLSEPCEEDGGWEGYQPTGKVMQWRVRFRDGVCIQLDGRDSPNNVAKPGEPWPYPYIINRDDIANDIAMYGEDSWQVACMDWGVFPKDALARRVITRSMCERFRAQEEPVWSHEPLIRIFCMDAAYGAVGGDRCVGIELAFGKCSDGVTRLAFAGQPMVIPVKADAVDEDGKPILPEDQIVVWVRNYCENATRTEPIPLSHVAFDSTGRGSLVAAFARLWGNDFHTVEFGGAPSDRPVSAKIQTPCKVYYANFVTELWFNAATLIIADQCRGMPTSVMEEGMMRAYEQIKEKKIQVERKSSKEGKPGCKERMGRSPDLFDCFIGETLVAMGDSTDRRLDELSIGDVVKTPFGNSKVLAIHEQEVTETIEVSFNNGSSLEGKPDHCVFTWDSGWVRMDALSIDNEIESIQNLGIWEFANTLFTKVTSSGFKQLVGTFRTGGRMFLSDFYTELSGLRILVQFLMVLMFTIRIMIGEIVSRIISNFEKSVNMLVTIQKNVTLRILSGPIHGGRMESLRQLLGISRKKAGNGIRCMASNPGSEELLILPLAKPAEEYLIPIIHQRRVSAPIPAHAKPHGLVTELFRLAKSAASLLKAVNRTKSSIAPESARRQPQPGKRKVYCITLENHNVFYANGILVANSFVVGIELAQRLGFVLGQGGSGASQKTPRWLLEMLEGQRRVQESHRLKYR